MINMKQNFIRQKFFKLFTIISIASLLSACSELGNISLFKNDGIQNNSTKVAVLLPTSGEQSEYYQELNKMVKLGLSDGAQGKITVTSYDCSNQELLKDSLKKIVSDQNNIVIGPVFSSTTDIAATKLRNKNITIVSLSNNPVLADSSLFVMGHAPMRQTEFLVNELLSKGYNNYIALLPAGRYSQSVSSVIREMLKDKNATLARVEYYNNSEEDIARAIRVVSDSVDSLNEADYNLTRPIILLADDPNSLKAVFGYTGRYRLDKKAILAGDSRINSIESNKMGIIFTGSINSNTENIINKAAKLNINHLGFMHQIAYDAGLLVAKNSSEGYNKSNFLEKMKNTQLDGLSGQIHFVDSIAQRKYDIVLKEKNTFTHFVNSAIPTENSKQTELQIPKTPSTQEQNLETNLESDAKKEDSQ